MLKEFLKMIYFIIISIFLNYIVYFISGILSVTVETYILFVAIEIVSILLYFNYRIFSKLDDIKIKK
ncbi:MAG: hypothetical protein ACRC7N_07330 [Clostridium sp.]